MQNPLPIIDGLKTIIAALAMIGFGFYGTYAGWHDPSVGWEMLLTAAAVLGVRDSIRRSAQKTDDLEKQVSKLVDQPPFPLAG